jgi:hypothetical protein
MLAVVTVSSALATPAHHGTALDFTFHVLGKGG